MCKAPSERDPHVYEENYGVVLCPVFGHPDFDKGAYHHPLGLCCVTTNRHSVDTPLIGDCSCGLINMPLTAVAYAATCAYQPCRGCPSPWNPFFWGDCPCTEQRVTQHYVRSCPMALTDGPALQRRQLTGLSKKKHNEPKDGVWREYSNIDMCQQGDVDIIADWKKVTTLEALKSRVERKGWSAVCVGSFDHAALKSFSWQLKPEHCRPSEHYTNKLYIWFPGETSEHVRRETSEHVRRETSEHVRRETPSSQLPSAEARAPPGMSKVQVAVPLEELLADEDSTRAGTSRIDSLSDIPVAYAYQPPCPPGVWREYRNIDMCGQGDKCVMHGWRGTTSLEELKRKVEQEGWSAISVGAFDHAALKAFDFQLTPEHCKKSKGYTNTLHIWFPEKGLKQQVSRPPLSDFAKAFSKMVLVGKGSDNACIFHEMTGLMAGSEVPLTLASHPGYGICMKYNEERTFKEWRYIESAVGPAHEATRASYLDGKFISVAGHQLVFDVAFWKMDLGNAVNFVGGSSVRATKKGGGGRDWTLNPDGTISAKHHPHLVLGVCRHSFCAQCRYKSHP
ncbi:hypothetical protein CYMTET_22676 [Cymbomonas tetramitiformis]|uniref:Uncharacterized protein n=1 Tax=Cymbomonas tetramitiformis TaxID=36881 RepID=A0AAE0FZZ9_9CHLO|nr:hypothetical protein CYMTET_22676 [Cymbomonas tetramitiformis]